MLIAAGFCAGSMNALAGGGSFVTLPVLIASGVPSVSANATSSLALYPGGAASVWVYRDSAGAVCGVPLVPMLLATLFGGLAGSLILLWTPDTLFDDALPWLLLLATTTLIFGPSTGELMRTRLVFGKSTVLTVQFLLGIYGGYFGGAVGLMMVAAWGFLRNAEVKALNAPRTILVTAANTIAVICFIIADAVRWKAALAVGVGATAGGYVGAHLGRRLNPSLVRGVTQLIAAAITAHFFIRTYF